MCYNTRARGCSSMAERQLPKLNTRVRFPSPAPASAQSPLNFVSGNSLRLLPKTALTPLRLLSNPKHFGFGFVFYYLADFVSFATTIFLSEQSSSLIHSVAPPLQIEPASLGFNLGFYFLQSPFGFVSGISHATQRTSATSLPPRLSPSRASGRSRRTRADTLS